MNEVRIPPPVLAAAAAAVQFALTRGRRPAPWSIAAALLVASVSVALGLWSLRGFRRADTTFDPIDVEDVSSLVTTGANGITRNPMYVGMAGLLKAHAIARRSPIALLPVLGFVVAIDRLQIPAEERALERAFGGDYERYRASTPRWFGLASLRAFRALLGADGA